MSTSRTITRATSRLSSSASTCSQIQTTSRQHLLRHNPTASPSHTSQQIRLQSTLNSSSLPKIAQSSTWNAMVPKFLRDRDSRTPSKTDVHPRRSSKEWNPATFYIIIFLLIGSQAVHLLVLRKDYETYSRRADAKLELLREVIARLQKGENVDVEKILGTGDEAKEREWEEVLRQIEEEDSLWRQKSAQEEEQTSSAPTKGLENQRTQSRSIQASQSISSDSPKETTSRSGRFY